MRRAKYGDPSDHEYVSVPEFAVLLGFRTTKLARKWLSQHHAMLGLHIGEDRVPRRSLELARGLLTDDSAFTASAKLEAYLKERHDPPRERPWAAVSRARR